MVGCDKGKFDGVEGVGGANWTRGGEAAVGGRYVMPMALCKPERSSLSGMKASVTSPGWPPWFNGGMQNLMMESGLRSEYIGSACTDDGSKYFISRIFLAAAGAAKMVVWISKGFNWRSVASWQ